MALCHRPAYNRRMPAKIGFETFDSEGPGIFLSRLQKALETKDAFDAQNPDVWINLSFKPVPDWIKERRAQGQTKVAIRMDGAYCSRWYKIRKPKVIPVPLLDDWYSGKTNFKKNALIRENLLGYDDIIFQSEFSRRLTQRFVTETQSGKLIYNGIDLDEFNPHGVRDVIAGNQSVKLLASHSFRPHHRLHDVMRILSHLRYKEPQKSFHLYIMGGDDGKSFDYARQMARQEKLEEGHDYTFLGKRNYAELPQVYRSCDLMLNLSYWDTCPNVVIEAMACGLPVVGPKYGGVEELVRRDGGILVPEDIPFTYIDHHNFERMPKAPIDFYAKAVLAVLEKKEEYAASARQAAEERLDIQKTATWYSLMADMLAPQAVKA